MKKEIHVTNLIHKHCSNCGWPISIKAGKAFSIGICSTCRKAIRDFERGKTEALDD